MATLINLKSTSTGYISIPSTTTTPSSSVPALSYNSTEQCLQTVYNATIRKLVKNKATGGTITYADGYTIHTFTSSGTFTPLVEPLICEILLVGGGGGGGYTVGGGGGGGGVLYIQKGALSAKNHIVIIGAGGTSNNPASNGGNTTLDTLVVSGGGGGGGDTSADGLVGGSGGGGSCYSGRAGAGIIRQGCYGGDGGDRVEGGRGIGTTNAGGGGGASCQGAMGGGLTRLYLNLGDYGASGSMGGAGFYTDISGIWLFYGSGGGGGRWNTNSPDTFNQAGAGGPRAGNGKGFNNSLDINQCHAQVNSGGGGGGGSGGDSSIPAEYGGGNGGSGIVIIKYPTL